MVAPVMAEQSSSVPSGVHVTSADAGVTVQIAPCVVMSTGAPLAVAVAVNWAMLACVIETLPELGWITIAVMPPRNTVAVAEALTAWALAWMVAVPSETPASEPPALMVATDGVSLDQERPLVTAPVLPSLKVPKTESGGTNVVLISTCGEAGEIVIAVSVGFTKKPRQLPARANVASAPKAPASRSFCLVDDIII